MKTEQQEEAIELIEAVANIGVDFGYGKFELDEEHILRARQFLEKVEADKQNEVVE